MWGVNAVTVRSLCVHECVLNNKIFAQSVRWKRKPIWLPTAKSKVFRIPERPVLPPDEKAELFRLHSHYKTYLNSILSHLARTFNEQKCSGTRLQLIEENLNNHFMRVKQINDEWNKQVAAEREQRLEKERQEEMERIKTSIAKQEEEKIQNIEKIEKEVSNMLAEADTFITEKNIDAAIDEALKTVIDYNYCIDLKGKIHKEDLAFAELNKEKEENIQAQ